MGFLDGQVAVVTGAAQGLGLAFAHALAREGASIAICDVQPQVESAGAELEQYGTGVLARVTDISVPDRVQAFLNEVDDRFGRLDVLVSSAGRWQPTPVTSGWEEALADYDRVVTNDSFGTFLVGRLAMPLLARTAGGNLVIMTADDVMPAHREDTNPADTDLYNATRWALGSLMQSWAQWMKERNVRVNALCVGPTDTPGGREMYAGRTVSWLQPEAVAAVLLELLREGPDGRTGENIGVWPGRPLELGPRKLPHRAMTG